MTGNATTPLSRTDRGLVLEQDSEPVEDAVRLLVELATKLPAGADADGVLVDVVVGDARCVVTTVAQEPSDAVHSGLVGLSPREQEIARMVASGYTNKEIASVLEISSWTVSTHLRRIFSKLEVGTRAAMVARVFAGALTTHSRRQLSGHAPPDGTGHDRSA